MVLFVLGRSSGTQANSGDNDSKVKEHMHQRYCFPHRLRGLTSLDYVKDRLSHDESCVSAGVELVVVIVLSSKRSFTKQPTNVICIKWLLSLTLDRLLLKKSPELPSTYRQAQTFSCLFLSYATQQRPLIRPRQDTTIGAQSDLILQSTQLPNCISSRLPAIC